MKKLILLVAFIALPLVGFAQLAKYQALYLFNFSRYIEWPAEYQNGDFTIGVVGNNAEITPELKDIASKRKVGTQMMEVVEFKNASDIKKCHILFIPKNKMGNYENIAAKAKSYNILIVTEESYFPDSSSINMVYDGTKLKYDVNVPNTKTAGLKISDRLLAVSK